MRTDLVRLVDHFLFALGERHGRARITRAELALRATNEPVVGGFTVGPRSLAEVERAYVSWVLERCGGNRSAAAKVLDISRNTLARQLTWLPGHDDAASRARALDRAADSSAR